MNYILVLLAQYTGEGIWENVQKKREYLDI